MFSKSIEMSWDAVPFDEASAEFDLGALTDGAIDPTTGELFPEDAPDYFVHRGNVVARGPASFGAAGDEEFTAWVIDGDLTVDGPLDMVQGDYCAILVVTGSVTCTDALIAVDANLVVGGSLQVRETLVTDLSQLGSLCVTGSTKATRWLELSSRGTVKLAGGVDAEVLYAESSGRVTRSDEQTPGLDWSAALPAEVLAPGDPEQITTNLRAAMREGAPTVQARRGS